MRLRTILIICAVTMPVTAAGQGTAASAAAKAVVPPAPQLSPEDAALLKQRDDLTTAIVKRDPKRVAAWIRAHQNVNFNFDDIYRGRTFQSPLTLAISRDFVDVARVLLESGAEANRKDNNGGAAIHYAKSAEAVRLLAQHGADLNATDRYGKTAAASAAEKGNFQMVDTLVASGAQLGAPMRDPDLLARAVESRRPETIPALLERGVDPRKPPTRALWLLIEGGDSENALLLIRRGADPSAANDRGETVLSRALFRQRWDVAEALIDAGANVRLSDASGCRGGYGCQSLMLARLASLNPGVLAKLKTRGLELNAVSSEGHTALSSLVVEQPLAVMAVRQAGVATVSAAPVRGIPAPDNAARVKALLDAGADPNIQYRGAAPLMYAIAMNRPSAMADALAAAGGKVEYEATFVRGDAVPTLAGRLPGPELTARSIPTNSISLIGMSVGPLTWAAQHGRPDIALRQLEREKRVTRADRHLMFFAAAAGQWDLVIGATRYTREVDASDRADVTALMMAAEDGRADAVQALLAAGASVNARSARRWPPLADTNLLAAFAGHSPSPPRLAGGYTALRAAKEKGHTEVVRILTEAGGRE